MREIWETPFGNAALKIERAKKHIADIEQRLLTANDAYELSMGIHADTGKQFIYYGLSKESKYIRGDLALMIGDAIHNLRCALDIIYRDTLKRLSPSGFDSTRTKFPVSDTKKHLETTLTKTAKVDATSPLFDFMVNRLRSYDANEGGDFYIWAIHRLDIHDKHQLLIPVLNILAIDGVELEQEDRTIDYLTIVLTSHLPYRKVVPLGCKFKNYGQATFQVKFRDGIPAEGRDVIPTLKQFAQKTERVVRDLQRVKNCPVTASSSLVETVIVSQVYYCRRKPLNPDNFFTEYGWGYPQATKWLHIRRKAAHGRPPPVANV